MKWIWAITWFLSIFTLQLMLFLFYQLVSCSWSVFGPESCIYQIISAWPGPWSESDNKVQLIGWGFISLPVSVPFGVTCCRLNLFISIVTIVVKLMLSQCLPSLKIEWFSPTLLQKHYGYYCCTWKKL